ncbi:c-type cytochrome [Bradyrhizobium sp.]|uniref:c-type cytochrome n=1 Tax=Bradyrhizobium sp. TaxID=376 RepID=UPI003C606C0E
MMRTIVLAFALLLLAGEHRAGAESTVSRGAYLVNTILACGNCHTPRDADGGLIRDRALSGGLTITTPTFTATAPNITPDRETGLGDWSEAEIRRALIEGIRPDHGGLPGVPLAAVMPIGFYKALLPDDLAAIIAYLRTVKPVRNKVAEPVYRAPVHRAPYPDAEAGFTKADFSDPVRRGQYLVPIGHCMECHSTFSAGSSDYRGGLGRGGRPFGPALIQGLGSEWRGAVAPNITSDPAAGIGRWSDTEIDHAIRQGIARDGRRLNPPMAFVFYAGLTDADVGDIIAYLRTLK